MEDTYEKVKMKGLHGRDITGVDDFQRDILNQNKFHIPKSGKKSDIFLKKI